MPPGTELRQIRFRRPPGATDILLIRHGESQAARPDVPFPLVDGLGDPELHPDGRAQAGAVARRLADEDIAAIYVTTLRRTAQTAAPLAGLLGLTPIVEPDLREVHLGDWEGGVYRSRVAAGDPLLAEVLHHQRWDVIPGAEPAEAFGARVRNALDRVAAAHPDQLVAVFTHGGVIGEALAQTASSARLAFSAADNASISQVIIGPGLRTVRRFNDTSHLAQTLASVAAPLR
ncbi:MAG: histidine phosphatase family protein [Actinomycetota bacterium]|nr:histidine phosphatase family protein [Actinomycetota bacterium]